MIYFKVFNMENLFFITVIALLFVNECQSCALPYWWSEQFHFPPFYPQSGQPKSTYNYRETYRQIDPNNFVRIQEYSEYTWWEQDASNNRPSNTGFLPGNFGRGVQNAMLPKGTGHKEVQLHGAIPRQDRNNHIDSNNIVPAGDTNGITHDDTNGIVPAGDPVAFDDTNGMMPENEAGISEINREAERERNEKERESIEINDLEVSGESKASYAVTNTDQSEGFFNTWFGGQVLNETKPCKVSDADIHSLRSMIEKMFSFPREHMEHPETKEKARDDILNKFRAFGLQVWTQNFTTPPLKNPGAMGSNYFVDHYLIPEELKRARARFQGAFILDGILNYNDVPNTQELPLDYAESLPGLQYFVNNTGNRGNFLAMISRNEMDNHLSQKLMEAWQELGNHQYKLFNLAVEMGDKVPPPSVIERHLNFLRSDHATFWYHNSSSHFPESLNAVLLTDTGPFRGQMKECYHSKCDDLTVMSPEKLQFAKKTADALTATLVELTSATALGNQVQPMHVFYFVLHAFILFCATKQLF
ncbi:uncharacterized protein LOC129218790 [Uloborus diversus]|uniref:uncharacterized protein LOC129218790 n=1 Tax=Uloborus diversus TaxID=327109 RepID=UPI00240A3B98|nr:uncharacterized protein LOC129218790 [Uloborus diversus]